MDSKYKGLGFDGGNFLNAFRDPEALIQGECETDHPLDTALRLDTLRSTGNHVPLSKGVKRKWSCVDGNMGHNIKQPSLCLGLSRFSPPTSSESKASSGTTCTAMSSVKETEVESSVDLELDFSLHLGGDKSPSSKKPARSLTQPFNPQKTVDLELSLSTIPSESDVTSIHYDSPTILQISSEAPLGIGGSQLNDDSYSSFWVSPLAHTSSEKAKPGFFFKPASGRFDTVATSVGPDLSASTITAQKSSVTCTSGTETTQQRPQHRSSNSKICKFTGCTKGARGASGLCIAHGGGRRCQKPGCHKGAEGRTAFCKAHGGGRRCQTLGCTKSAEGRTDFCIAHGGGRRCSHEGCTRAARGRSGRCIRHGGGKRCQMENCTRSAEGLSGLCISHGGGRRCQYPDCSKGAQGSTMYCKAHGGGKRCTVEGCTKGAEGSTPFCKGHGGGKRCSFLGCPKSVHGGTSFCVAHGGGKRCAIPDCTKSARGRTDFCVRHGGGKRCRVDGCGKSAQGSTDFCKAHGGGKRCSWGHPGSQFGNLGNDQACISFARGKTGLCAMHGALVQDKRVHGGFTLGPMLVQDSKSDDYEEMESLSSDGDMNAECMNLGFNEGGCSGSDKIRHHHHHLSSGVEGHVPEGRVHGGSLLALLTAGGSGQGSS